MLYNPVVVQMLSKIIPAGINFGTSWLFVNKSKIAFSDYQFILFAWQITSSFLCGKFDFNYQTKNVNIELQQVVVSKIISSVIFSIILYFLYLDGLVLSVPIYLLVLIGFLMNAIAEVAMVSFRNDGLDINVVSVRFTQALLMFVGVLHFQPAGLDGFVLIYSLSWFLSLFWIIFYFKLKIINYLEFWSNILKVLRFYKNEAWIYFGMVSIISVLQGSIDFFILRSIRGAELSGGYKFLSSIVSFPMMLLGSYHLVYSSNIAIIINDKGKGIIFKKGVVDKFAVFCCIVSFYFCVIFFDHLIDGVLIGKAMSDPHVVLLMMCGTAFFWFLNTLIYQELLFKSMALTVLYLQLLGMSFLLISIIFLKWVMFVEVNELMVSMSMLLASILLYFISKIINASMNKSR